MAAIEDALFGAVEPLTSRGACTVAPEHLLKTVFLKAVSDLADDGPRAGVPVIVPEDARFEHLHSHQQRNQLGNVARLESALDVLERENPGVFDGLSVGLGVAAGVTKEEDAVVGQLLEALQQSEIDLRPSRLGGPMVAGELFWSLVQRLTAIRGAERHWVPTTPAEVAALMTQLLEPDPTDTIYDPACGSGAFLTACTQALQSQHGGGGGYRLFGEERDSRAWAIARMSTFLHGVPNARLEHGDSLRSPAFVAPSGTLEQFSVVGCDLMSAPSDWPNEVAEDDPYHRFLRGAPPKHRSAYAYIQHILASLTAPSGRAAVLTTLGTLYRIGVDGVIRRRLIEENLLDAVIELPSRLFIRTALPAAIMVFRCGKSDNKVLFVDASRASTKASRSQNKLAPEHVSAIVDAYRARQSVDGFAHLATFAEIRANEFNCGVARYVRSPRASEEANLLKIRRERTELRAELKSLDELIAGHLAALELEGADR